MSKLTQELAKEIVKEYMAKGEDYKHETRDEMVFGRAKCSLVVYEMYAQGEIDECERDYYLERAIYIKGHQHFRKHILTHTAESRKERQKEFTENMDKAESFVETKMNTEEIEQIMATFKILQEEGGRIMKAIEAADEDEELSYYWNKIAVATMSLGEVILYIEGLGGFPI